MLAQFAQAGGNGRRDQKQCICGRSGICSGLVSLRADPIGQRVIVGGQKEKPSEIVGIVGDVRDDELETKGRVAIYQPESQSVFESLYFGVRTAGDPEYLISSVRAAFRNLDPELPLDAVGTVDTLVETSLSQRRFGMLLDCG